MKAESNERECGYIKEIPFETFYINGKAAYKTTTIKLNSLNSYSQLVDLFFHPKESLGEQFYSIFPENIRYSSHHNMLLDNSDFRPWNGWVFRGQKQADWKLSSSLERLILNKNEYHKKNLWNIEKGIIRNFRRSSGAFFPEINDIPENEYYQFMAHLQHFGGATRFLDVTYSFFVALFFATNSIELKTSDEDKRDKNRFFSIWCFDRAWIEKRYKDFLPYRIKKLYKQDTFGKNVKTQKAVLNYAPNLENRKEGSSNKALAVINMNPYYFNTRLSRQKGSFLFPLNPFRSFEDNLFNMVGDKEENAWRILKIDVQYDNNLLIHLKKLLDSMNINNFTLFEDLDGMCRDINSRVFFHDDSITTPIKGGVRS